MAAKQTKYIPKPPRKKRKFTRTTKRGRSQKSTQPINHNNAQTSDTPTSNHSLSDLSRNQLLRKARDLINIQEMNKFTISELKLEIRQLKQAHHEQDARMQLMNTEHSQHLEGLEEGHANRIAAMTLLHADELKKKGANMKAMARNMSSDRKVSNKVSVATHIDMNIIFSPLNAKHSVLLLSHFPTLTNIVYCQCHYR